MNINFVPKITSKQTISTRSIFKRQPISTMLLLFWNLTLKTNILHQSVQLPKLDVRRETHLANFMYKYKNNELYVNKRNFRTRLHDAPVFKTTKPDCE